MRWLLNIDLGEVPDAEPEALYALAHLANIACGGHAGDAASMREALARCARHGTLVGAHPSYPDRAHFGRRALALDGASLRATVAEQCEALGALADAAGQRVRFAKAHGALYHAANADDAQARALVAGVLEALGYEVTLVGPPEGALARACAAAGVALLREGLADRGVDARGAVLPRGAPGAVLASPEEVHARARSLLSSGRCDTVCVHGDSPGALGLARAARAALDELAASRGARS